MPSLFLDHNPEDPANIEAFIKFIAVCEPKPEVVFVEFLTSDPPNNESLLKQEFTNMSARRKPLLVDAYLKLITWLRDKDIRVHGLSDKAYVNIRSCSFMAQNYFRWGGGFDTIAAEIIHQAAPQSSNFAVFISAGHVGHLSEKIPQFNVINPPVEENKTVEFSSDAKVESNVFRDSLLKKYLADALNLNGPFLEIKHLGKWITFGRFDILNEGFETLWQDKVGAPICHRRFRALHQVAIEKTIVKSSEATL
ncbi:hypothetical protein [Aliikangiella coralliicola]|uniref:Uncharacterized protein n=1 Tax=Aliikangiella coralliicola TaxID=2592383 RepID=A0A545UDT1_9GAMM|nr:hypothetical protein [Aliikangiella coralliicola]TQV87625.1 hypothetical protein FLL46_12200 [Aliikangiella coralliicola]